MERFRFPGETNPPQPVGTSDGQPTYALKASDVAEEHINRAEIAAKKAETREKRIRQFVEMLANGETL